MTATPRVRRPPPGYYVPEGEEVIVPARRTGKRGAPEAKVQRAIIRYLKVQFPGIVINASPGGAKLHGDPQQRERAMLRLIGLGLQPGWPDLEAFWRGQAWFFEVKAGDGRVREAQRAVGAMLEAQGFRWAVVRSVDEVAACIRGWRVEEVGRP